MLHLTIVVVFLAMEKCECVSSARQYQQYLESFPSTNISKIHRHRNTNTDWRRNQKHKNQDENFYQDENALYVGFGMDPFGPSEEVEQNRASEDMSFEQNSDRGNETRGKRGVSQLYNMITCTTGCNPLSYKGYGCYCGFLGAGQITDRIDRCCMLHDLCYSAANCPVFFTYFVPYLWKCWRGRPLCAIDHLGYGGPRSCAARLCECDRQLAMCLSYSPCPRRRALCTSSPLRLLQNLILL